MQLRSISRYGGFSTYFVLVLTDTKDVAIAMGLLQANEHLPGLEGGGIIRRLGQNTDSLKVGQRVVVSRKSSFANNLQSPVEAIYLLPDDMPYETSALIL